MSVQTPLARVQGLGAAHAGTGHFWRQRIGAVALVPLAIWFVCAALALIGAERNSAAAFLAEPVNAIAMALFVIAALNHMALGIQVVIEDYVHDEGPKIVLLVLNNFFAWIVGAACLFALVKIAVR
ncbi:MAG TPA: succinate dehydrogenase, hydrophobic membrane anchor protein [Rhizomicrobium sp.]|jgi:succinate dehydrogenase / fumarate reductase membrane anchor subunit|nr:succinate dehydrogenase, hydrophobic membrane anchor protein [Rhizomicrobium sp.]